MVKQVSLVIFDMDGLIFDTERLSIEGWKYAGELEGFHITKEIISNIIGLDARLGKQFLIDTFGSSFDYEKIKEIKMKYSFDYMMKHGIPIKNGLFELLDFLEASHIKKAVASSTDKERVHRYLRIANIENRFEQVICGDMVEKGKPEPDIFLKAASLCNVNPKNCMVLEDSKHGIYAVHKAGMKPVHIEDLVKLDEETKKLLYTSCDSLLDVVTLLEGNE